MKGFLLEFAQEFETKVWEVRSILVSSKPWRGHHDWWVLFVLPLVIWKEVSGFRVDSFKWCPVLPYVWPFQLHPLDRRTSSCAKICDVSGMENSQRKISLTSMAKQMSEKLLCGINGLAMILVVIYFDLCIGFLPIILLYYVRLQPGVSGN